MKVDLPTTAESPVMDMIHQAQGHFQAGRYNDALAMVTSAKAAETRNIFLIALEKQIARAAAVSKVPGGAKELAEIQERVTGLFDRATGFTRQGGAVDKSPLSVSPKGDDGEKGKEERLQALKNQYFERADAFIERGDYQNALAEVRRVMIIDPKNSVAKKYEEKISQLAAAQAKKNAAAEDRAEVPVAEHVHAHEPARAHEQPHPPAHPAQHHKEVTADRAEQLPLAPDPAEKTSVGKTIAIAAVVLVLLGIGGFVIFKGMGGGNKPLAPAQTSAPEQAAPAVAQQAAPVTQEQGKPIEESAVTVTAPKTQNNDAKSSKPSTPEPKKETPVQQQAPAQPAAAPPQQQQQVQQQAPPQQAPPQVAANTTPPPAAAPAQNNDPANEAFIPVEREPQVIKLEQPKLSQAAQRGPTSGRVIARVQIDASGKPVKVDILQSSNKLLNDAVVEACMNSQFTPAMMTTGPVKSAMTIPFKFK